MRRECKLQRKARSTFDWRSARFRIVAEAGSQLQTSFLGAPADDARAAKMTIDTPEQKVLTGKARPSTIDLLDKLRAGAIDF
jgi:hypothetical protein